MNDSVLSGLVKWEEGYEVPREVHWSRIVRVENSAGSK